MDSNKSLPFPAYCSVVVDFHKHDFEKTFTYGIPPELMDKIFIGAWVGIPFRTKTVRGFVIDMSQFPPSLPAGVVIKPIKEVLAPTSMWDKEMVEIARWMVKYYGTAMIHALMSMVPAPVRGKDNQGAKEMFKIRKVILINRDIPPDMEKKTPAQFRVIQALMEEKYPISVKDLMEKLTQQGGKTSDTVLKALQEKGFISIFEDSPDFIYYHDFAPETHRQHILNFHQQKAYDTISDIRKTGEPKAILLHGVTGSGKTEIYLRIIEDVIKDGREALVLIPEISLTPQTTNRFMNRFQENIGILHSRLTDTERRNMWWKIRNKEFRVVVGARSAVFAPLENIGVIVVDEEHEGSYKQEGEPKYHAKQVAIKRGIYHKCPVILASATPSFESYYWAKQGKYIYTSLPDRVGASVPPVIEIVDLKKDRPPQQKDQPQKYGIFGQTLLNALTETFDKKKQAILFLNRRGYSAFLLCRDCGNVLRCPYCDITLTYHKSDYTIKCHYCDYQRPAPDRCPICNSLRFSMPNLGIQKVEEEFAQLFPDVPLIRMDRDTTQSRDAHYHLLKKFADGTAQTLLGTQMIAKGLDFPGVTLVGVLMADISLYLPDFRSIERTYQLLTQVSGRAGRREDPGRVIIQSFNPETPVLNAVKEQNYDAFYQWEVNHRKPLNYPPFAHLINIVFSSEYIEAVETYSYKIGDLLKNKKFRNLFISILGPAPCPLARLKSRHRRHILIKGKNTYAMVDIVGKILKLHPPPIGVDASSDADPLELM